MLPYGIFCDHMHVLLFTSPPVNWKTQPALAKYVLPAFYRYTNRPGLNEPFNKYSVLFGPMYHVYFTVSVAVSLKQLVCSHLV